MERLYPDFNNRPVENAIRGMAGRLGRPLPEEYPTSLNNIEGIYDTKVRLNAYGGINQQDRMIRDKLHSLYKAMKYSYQGADVQEINQGLVPVMDDKKDPPVVRALINGNKLNYDVNDKMISTPFESGLTVGSIIQWKLNNSHWIIYLQDEEEIAYFRGYMRRCSHQISWEDEHGNKLSTYAALIGPGGNDIHTQVSRGLSLDSSRDHISFIIPQNEVTLKRFKRYSKFYLRDVNNDADPVCWQVTSVNYLSSPRTMTITAYEDIGNPTKDDMENGIINGRDPKPVDPHPESVIKGNAFIKSCALEIYTCEGVYSDLDWSVIGVNGEKVPVRIYLPADNNALSHDYGKTLELNQVGIVWENFYQGRFKLKCRGYEKLISVSSLM